MASRLRSPALATDDAYRGAVVLWCAPIQAGRAARGQISDARRKEDDDGDGEFLSSKTTTTGVLYWNKLPWPPSQWCGDDEGGQETQKKRC